MFGVMPCFPVVFSIWMLTGYPHVPYAHRDLVLLLRAVLCIALAESWMWMTGELVRWGRGNTTIQRAYMKWLKRCTK